MFLWNVKTCKLIATQRFLKACKLRAWTDKYVKEASKTIPKNIPKSMKKWCWIYACQMILTLLKRDTKWKPKRLQETTKRVQKLIKKTRQKPMSEKYRKIFQNPACPAPKSSLLISRYARGLRANGSPELCQSGNREIIKCFRSYEYVHQ